MKTCVICNKRLWPWDYKTTIGEDDEVKEEAHAKCARDIPEKVQFEEEG